MRSFRHVPVIRSNNLLDAVPEGPQSSASNSPTTLPHSWTSITLNVPCYIFGPENGSISDDILDHCTHKVMIPTMASLNLGMTVNIVMYDRLAKAWPKMQPRLERIDRASSHTTFGTNE